MQSAVKRVITGFIPLPVSMQLEETKEVKCFVLKNKLFALTKTEATYPVKEHVL